MPFDIADARARLADLKIAEPGQLRDRIRTLARPRMTGTEEALAVEAELRRHFEDLGYRAREMPFSFSTWPGAYGISVAGGAMVLAGIAGAWLLAAGFPAAALVVLVLTMAVALAPLITLDTALRRIPRGRVEARNLLFTRPGATPAWIVMAHRDSKSQLVPTLVRTAAVVTAAGAWVLLWVMTLLWWGGEPFRFTALSTVAGVVLAGSGALLALSWARNESPGALDNATGLAALLELAAETGEHGDVGFLLTDGEELGLVGARVAAPLIPPVQGIINVDGLDDHGPFIVAEGYGWRRRGSAPQLAAALLTAAAALDYPIQRRPLPRTLPVDHIPVAEAGIPSLTLLRGSWSSLMRVHARNDDADGLDGTGAASGATLLAAAIRLLRADREAHLAARRGPSS
jgi:hypothetical protein